MNFIIFYLLTYKFKDNFIYWGVILFLMSELNIEIMEELGCLTAKIRKEVSKLLKSGVMVSEIINFIEIEIFKRGFLPAFPATVSINEVAAHYTIFDDDIMIKKGDVVKVDFGLSNQGFITDNAFTVEIETNKYEKLLEINKKALDRALEISNVGVSMSEIGKEVNLIAKSNGFETIHNLAGHQVGINDLHCGLSVPNYENFDTSKILENNMLAIEPFLTVGSPKVKNGSNSNILHLVGTKSVRDPIAKKLLIHIKENYPKLPFSKRWLVKDIICSLNSNQKNGFDIKRVNYGINVLKKNGILHEYEKLVSVDGSIISQFEDMVVFIDNKKKIITRC